MRIALLRDAFVLQMALHDGTRRVTTLPRYA